MEFSPFMNIFSEANFPAAEMKSIKDLCSANNEFTAAKNAFSGSVPERPIITPTPTSLTNKFRIETSDRVDAVKYQSERTTTKSRTGEMNFLCRTAGFSVPGQI